MQWSRSVGSVTVKFGGEPGRQRSLRGPPVVTKSFWATTEVFPLVLQTVPEQAVLRELIGDGALKVVSPDL